MSEFVYTEHFYSRDKLQTILYKFLIHIRLVLILQFTYISKFT